MTTKTTAPSQAAWSRLPGSAVPVRTPGITRTGIATSAAVMRSDWTVSAVSAVVYSNPASESIRVWRAAPVAPPPGVTRLKALPASWERMMASQCSRRSAMAVSSHTHPKLAVSSATTTGSASGLKSPRRSHAENTSPMLGASR